MIPNADKDEETPCRKDRIPVFDFLNKSKNKEQQKKKTEEMVHSLTPNWFEICQESFEINTNDIIFYEKMGKYLPARKILDIAGFEMVYEKPKSYTPYTELFFWSMPLEKQLKSNVKRMQKSMIHQG